MKKNNFVIYFFFTIIGFIFSNHTKSLASTIQLSDSILVKKKEVRYGDYTLIVKMKYLDEMVENSNGGLFLYGLLEQEFIFKQGDSILNYFTSPALKISHKLNSGRIVELLETSFFIVKIVTLRGQELYLISASGGCNADCPDVSLLFSFAGKLLLMRYARENLRYKTHIAEGYSLKDFNGLSSPKKFYISPEH